MTPKDAAKLRNGDRILVEMVVIGLGCAPSVAAHPSSMSSINALIVHPADIHSILPRPLEAGDRVKLLGDDVGYASEGGSVLFVERDYAWIQWNKLEQPMTEALSDLQRVEDGE